MANLDRYNRMRAVPDEAKKTICAGRLKGFTDINPMWRIEKLTEEYGECGVGWKTDQVEFWLEPSDKGETAAFCRLNLYTCTDGKWSEPVFGIGGSMFIASEKSGPHVSDECYKMAYTDALSVACKSLGMGADVYWGRSESKYGSYSGSDNDPLGTNGGTTGQCVVCGANLTQARISLCKNKGIPCTCPAHEKEVTK